MSRRLVAQQNRRGGTRSVSTAQFAISAVSQTSGTLDGATVITVTAAGIVGTPTCTLGTVSSVGAQSFQVTVASHAAGAVSWTATNGNGQTSGSQTYTYLAHPSYSSISPSHGPETLTTTGVTITVTGLPAGDTTGCPVSVTFNGVAATAVTVTNSTHLTCTAPVGTVTTAVDVVVTVDTKSTTGTGAWTYDPPPSELSATNVSTSGGTGNIAGLNFVATPTASANINGTPTSLTVTFVSSSLLTYSLPAATYSAGTWNLTVTNPDGQSDVQPIFVVSSFMTPATIMGSDLKGQYIADQAVLSGSNVTSIPDNSGTGNTVGGGTSPTIVLASANWNTHNAVRWTAASSQYLEKTLFALGAGNTIAFAAPVKIVSDTGGVQNVLNYTLSDFIVRFSSGTHQLSAVYNGTPAANTTDVLGTKVTLFASDVGTAGTSNAIALSENNSADVTASATATIPVTAGTLRLGQRSGAGFADFESPEVCVFARKPNSTEQTALAQYFNAVYQVTPAPTFLGMTRVGTSGGTARISGTGFLSGVTVTAATIGSLSASFLNGTAIEVTVPAASAATYDITITNRDGNILTVADGLTVSATDVDEMVVLGNTCVGLFNAALGITTVSGNVSAWADQSMMGNALGQPTSADRPAFNATDANYNGLPSLTTTGSPIYMINSAFNPGTAVGTHEIFVLAMARLTTNPALRSHLLSAQGTGLSHALRYESAGKPIADFGLVTLIATWGSSVTNQTHMLASYGKTDGANLNLGINVANGTEVTATTASASNLTWTNPSTIWLMTRTNISEYLIGSVARVVVCTSRPSGAQLTRIASLWTSTYGSI